MLFAGIFLSLFVGGWLFCGFIPWLVLSVATRGGAGLWYLPLSLFTGVVAGLTVPVLIDDGVRGIWLSFGAAATVPTVLLAASRLSLHGAHRQATSLPEQIK